MLEINFLNLMDFKLRRTLPRICQIAWVNLGKVYSIFEGIGCIQQVKIDIYKSRGSGRRLWLLKITGQVKKPPQAEHRAWLGPAFFGPAWPGFGAGAGTSPLLPFASHTTYF